MGKFINDLMTLTQMQFFVKYWWIWLVMIIIATILINPFKKEGK